MERIIRKDVSFIQASLSNFNTLAEQSIFNLTLYLMQKTSKLSYSNEIVINIVSLKQYLSGKVKRKSNVKIIDILKSLIEKTLTLNVLQSTSQNKQVLFMSIYTNIIYDETTKKITLKINDSFLKYFLEKEKSFGLKSGAQYSKILMSVTQQTKNKYTPKILEFLSIYTKFSSEKTNNNVIVSVDTLRKVFNLNDKLYVSFKDFNYLILKKIQKECKKFDLEFSYKMHKEGRSVSTIEFVMTNEAKKKFYRKISNAKTDDSNDYILNYIKDDIQLKNIEYLNNELKECAIFHDVVKEIQKGDCFSLYKLVYKNAKSNNGESLYRLVNFEEFKIIIEYFKLKSGEKYKDTKLIQDILNERRS